MRRNTIRWLYAIALVVTASPALASFHLWVLNEIYSNADGTVQFIELSTPYSGEEFLAGHPIISSQGAATHSFIFPSDLPGDSAGRTFLIGTPGFAALGLVAPDYIVPNGFLFTTNGSVNYAGVDSVSWAALPVDGTLSIDRNGATAINSPKNFAGATTTLAMAGFGATASGPLTARVLNATVQAASADVGASRQVFVAAILGSQIFFRTAAGWQLWTGGSFPAYSSGALPPQMTIQVLDGSLDVSGVVGAQVYVGYGTDSSEMLASRRYALVYTVQ
jgi:hypothetical protein